MACFIAMSILDLSTAFDLVNLDLLIKRLKIMGIPDDLLQLLEVWLRQRLFYVEANGQNSSILENDVGTIQGSILGPIRYALFIRPLYKITKATTFADDNYMVKFNKEKKMALEELKKELEKIIKWLKGSGLKVNEKRQSCAYFIEMATLVTICNKFYDPSVSYVDLHILHKRALPSKFCLYRHCLLLHKVFNDSIPKRDWIDLNFQMINTSRKTDRAPWRVL